MVQEPGACLLPDLEIELVLVGDGLLEELRNLLEGRVALDLVLFLLFDVLQEESVGLLVNFLATLLGVLTRVVLQGLDPVDLGARHPIQIIYRVYNRS